MSSINVELLKLQDSKGKSLSMSKQKSLDKIDCPSGIRAWTFNFNIFIRGTFS